MTISSAIRPESIGTLYADHHPWLRAWLRKKLGCIDQAADLAQDTFLRVLSSQQALPALNEPRAFLTTIAQRVLSNHWRRQKLEQAYLDALMLAPPHFELSPEERSILLEALIELDQVLNGLPLLVKRAFLLTQLDGLGHAETAELLGISVRTVKRHIVKAGLQCYFGTTAMDLV
ncbi:MULTISPECIES: sigma-70 family RNA polymerase sigma factor [unclassified Janthinobacterium]|uniref:sigma-70 family RNA polymerase sigma factor n=1 Tax=unclassified Janthinobacterium TaxID=2610881 RepID=UPI00181A40C2|nr:MULTISPECIES: sigma-70 family RNA polymerase sigma factor [unclassified Janthinobacterium]MBB5610731.1 RNA polymerase sigma-70 factor (ECF subfamily) [Janthinobacterium sp. S3T4]MBB5616217.1 RNA polymerase sigma-70 factor (ECF subfamily) [Janthinobacterium sp. S3M3]